MANERAPLALELLQRFFGRRLAFASLFCLPLRLIALLGQLLHATGLLLERAFQLLHRLRLRLEQAFVFLHSLLLLLLEAFPLRLVPLLLHGLRLVQLLQPQPLLLPLLLGAGLVALRALELRAQGGELLLHLRLLLLPERERLLRLLPVSPQLLPQSLRLLLHLLRRLLLAQRVLFPPLPLLLLLQTKRFLLGLKFALKRRLLLLQ